MKHTALTVFLILSIFLVPLTVFANETSISQVIQKIRQSNDDVQDMSCIFVKEINKAGKEIPKTSMTLKYIDEPKTIFVEFINRLKGQKCLYVEGQNNGKIVVRPPGFFKFLTVKVDPAGKKAMAENLNPMTDLGFGPLIDSLETSYDLSLTDDRYHVDFQENVSEDGGLFHLIKITSDSEKADYLYLHINRDTFLPYKFRYKKDNNTATYTYKNVKLNIDLKKEDFKV